MADKQSLSGQGRHTLAVWTGWMCRFAGLITAAMVLLTALAGWYTATNLGINTSTTDMISAETPFRRNAIAFDKAFPQSSGLIVAVIDAPTPEDAEDAAERLAAALQEKPELFSRVERPGAEPYFRRNGLLFLDVDELAALADRLAQAEPLLASLAQQPNLRGLFDVLTLAMRDGGGEADIGALLDRIAEIAEAQAERKAAVLSWRNLTGLGGGRRQIVLVRAAPDSSSLAPGGAALGAIRETAKDIGIHAANGATLRLTGSVALDYEELQSAALGGKTAGLLSLLLVALLMIVGLRSVTLILAAMFTLTSGLVWTAAFAAVTVGHLNLISIAFAVLFVGLGIDFSIHYCLRYREALNDRQERDESLRTAASEVGGSLTIGAVCATLGFLAFLPTDYKGLAELGLISAGGMLIALILSLSLLPALLSLLPAPRPRPGISIGAVHLPRSGRIITVAALILGVAGALKAYDARFDFNPMNLKDPESESVTTFYDLARDTRNGVYAIDLLTAGRDAAKTEADRLAALPAVGNAVTVESLVPGDQAKKLGIIADAAFFLAPVLAPAETTAEPPAARRSAVDSFRSFLAAYGAGQDPLADRARRAAAALDAAMASGGDPSAALERRLLTHLPRMFRDLTTALSAERVTLADLPSHVRDAWIAADGRARVQLWPAKPIGGNADLRRFAAAVLSAAPTAVGTPVTITEAGDAVVKAFQEATIYAFITIVVVLLTVLRRIADTLLVLFPLVLAAIYTGATAALLGLPLNFANVIVLPLLFGLGVASGIHLVVRARRATDTGSLMRTSTPRAVLFSALTTIASFGSLALSGHRGMTSMGQLLTIAIVYTLVCTLIVLPALMAWIEHRANR